MTKNSYPEKSVVAFTAIAIDKQKIIDILKLSDCSAEIKRSAYVIMRNETGNFHSIINGTNPTGTSIAEGNPIQYQDGMFANELGSAYFGDPNSGTYLRGLSIKTQIGNYNPFMIATNNKCYINSTNTSLIPIPLSDLSVAGSASIGTYATTTAAPTNGLLVSGKTGISLSSLNSTDSLQVGGSILANSNIKATSFNSTATQTNLNSPTSPIFDSTGSITISFPEQGSVDKQVSVYLSNFSTKSGQNCVITFASTSGGSAFTNIPYIWGTATALSAATATATTLTITSTTPITGWIFGRGY